MPGGVLVGLDGSTAAQRALEYALDAFPGRHVVALYVVDPVEADYDGLLPPMLGYWGEWYDREERRAEEVLAAAVDLGRERDVDVTPVQRRGRAAREIASAAASDGVTPVVVGAHGRTDLAHAVLGDVAAKVARRSSVPVTVVR